MKNIYLTCDPADVRVGDLILGSGSPVWWTVTSVERGDGWVYGKTVHSDFIMKVWVTSTSPAMIARNTTPRAGEL